MMRLLFILLLCSVARQEAVAGPVVTLSDGRTLEGVSYSNGVNAYFGVPFATASRWTDPGPTSWSGQLNATSWGPHCPQVCKLPAGKCPMGGQSEDCLNLNVFAPTTGLLNNSLLPVMVFFYGGGYLIGGPQTPLYNGTLLAGTAGSPVVVVTINYRLGALGFLHYGNATGNYGMKDQIASLQWLQENARAFGGDPNNVLVFGQSAGGMSVMALLLSPKAAGLFHKVCIHSDPITLAYFDAPESIKMSTLLVQLLGCDQSSNNNNNTNDSMDCLLSVPTETIVKLQLAATALDTVSDTHVFQFGAPWEPWVDGEVLAGQPLVLLQQGLWNRVPVMLGSVNNEGTMFAYAVFHSALSDVDYRALLHVIFGEQLAPQVLQMYPPAPPPAADCRPQLSQLLTDYVFVCPIRNCTTAFASSEPTYLWHFNHSIDDEAIWGPGFQGCAEPGQVCHGSELPFVFGTLGTSGTSTWGPGEQQLSDLMLAQWTSFAYTSNPNKHPGVVATDPQLIWNPYAQSAQNDFRFQIGASSMETQYRAAFCDAWDSVGYGYGSYYGIQATIQAFANQQHAQ